MANQYFTITPPTSGTGQGVAEVSATTTNYSTEVRRGSLDFTTNWGRVAHVSVVQKYRPYITQGPTTIPASGGSITFTAMTEYDVVFRSVPEWVTITSDGVTYAEGQRIPAATANGRVFTITAGENTGDERVVANTMNMGHYANNLLQRYVSYISFTQEGVAPTRDIYLTPIYIEVASGDTAATVNIVATNTSLDHYTTSSAGTFNINAEQVGNTFRLTFPVNHEPTSTRGYLSFYLYDNQGGAWTSTVTVVRAAGETPSIIVSPTALTIDYNSYDTGTFTITTNCTVTVNSLYPQRFSVSRNGNTVTVTALNANFGTSDVTGTITVVDADGLAETKSVEVTQRYRPRVVQSPSGVIPASGGTINFTIDSEYDIRLKDIPAFITVSDTLGGTYVENQVITPAQSSGKTFVLTFAANSSSNARDEGTFHAECSVGGTWTLFDGDFNFEQAAYAEKYILISPQTMYLDYTANRVGYFDVSTQGVSSMTPSLTDTGNFSVEPEIVYNTVGVTTEEINETNAYRNVTLTLTDRADASIHSDALIIQRFRPYFILASDYVPASGGTINFTIHTDYDIDFYDIPSYVTVKDNNNNTITAGQRITAENANNKTFSLVFAANQSSSSRSVFNTFCMRNYMFTTVLDYKQFFHFSQGGAQVQEVVDFSIAFEHITQGNRVTVTIALNSGTYAYDTLTYYQDGTQDEETVGEFDVIAAEGDDVTFTLKIDSATFEPFVVHLDYNDGAEGNVDTIYTGETIALVTQYVPGASVTFRVEN